MEAEGVLDHSPHLGGRVAEVDVNEVYEIYLIRNALESLTACESVPYLTRADIAYLRGLEVKTKALIAERHHEDLTRLNLDFHMHIYNAAGLPQLYRLITNMWNKFPRDTLHVLPGRAADSLLEHGRIIESIEAGDAVLVGRYMQEHISDSCQELIEFLATQAEQENLEVTDPNLRVGLPSGSGSRLIEGDVN